MIARRKITLYHSTPDPETREERFSRRVYDDCSVYQTVLSEKRYNRSGPWRERDTVIRILTDEKIDVAVGDRVALDRCDDSAPPPDSLMVCGFADDRRGSARMRHWKVVCR